MPTGDFDPAIQPTADPFKGLNLTPLVLESLASIHQTLKDIHEVLTEISERMTNPDYRP